MASIGDFKGEFFFAYLNTDIQNVERGPQVLMNTFKDRPALKTFSQPIKMFFPRYLKWVHGSITNQIGTD
jgi:hypothetical protein